MDVKMTAEPGQLRLADDHYLAYSVLAGRKPTVLFLCGYRSDMSGLKASALADHCQQRNYAFVRFDYRGHGKSSGEFEDLTIAEWYDDALRIVDQIIDGPIVLIGSSMGGWVMSLVARARPERIVGMIGISVAPDFTHRVLEPSLSDQERSGLARDGVIYRPSEYDQQPYPVTARLLEQGQRYRVLEEDFSVRGPVRLVHGTGDVDVPWTLSLDLAERMQGDDIDVIVVKDADHRLSSKRDIQRLMALLDEIHTAV